VTSAAARAEIVVDLDAIAANTAVLRERVGRPLMAVVKADGYGHGLVPSARAVLAGGADFLGVAVLDEALALRTAGITAPVLAWLHGPGTDYAAALAAGVEVSVNAGWALDDVLAAVRATGRPARVHLKADTGLSRGGATPEE
jgi:alanine racemase